MHNLVQISHDATRRFIVHSSLKLHSWKLAIFYLESQSIITANASLSRKDVDIPSFEKFLKSGLVFIAISDAGDHVLTIGEHPQYTIPLQTTANQSDVWDLLMTVALQVQRRDCNLDSFATLQALPGSTIEASEPSKILTNTESQERSHIISTSSQAAEVVQPTAPPPDRPSLAPPLTFHSGKRKGRSLLNPRAPKVLVQEHEYDSPPDE